MQRIERDKAIADYLKHIGTISALAAGIVATLTSRTSPIRPDLAAYAVIMFMISLAFSLVTYGLSLSMFFARETEEISFFAKALVYTLLAITPLFLIGGFCMLSYAMVLATPSAI